jgi:hypothetical protein
MKSRNYYRIKLIVFSIVLFQLIGVKLLGQSTLSINDTINKKRLNTVIYTGAGLYTAALGVLYFAWYKDSDLTGFHWFNDNKAWMQVDKVGHATTAYIMTNYAFWSLKWAGVDNNKSAIYGGLMGFTAMTVIEILDGFSSEWGASPGDLLANTTGSLLFTGQQLLWKEQRIRLKFSYQPTEYAQYRPDLLGENDLQRVLKDYNGQTYWLSANIKSFLHQDSKIPAWINVAFGYGAKGMLGANSNPQAYNGQIMPTANRVRQYYLSMDVDWTRIETKSKGLRFAFKVLNFIKLPFPAMEYNNENGMVFHWLYY